MNTWTTVPLQKVVDKRYEYVDYYHEIYWELKLQKLGQWIR